VGNDREGTDRARLSVSAREAVDSMTVANDRAPFATENVPSEIETRRLVTAKAWKRASDLPGKIFGDRMLFVNPAFNILLDLYISLREGQLVNVSSACIASGAPATTALRYISRLSQLEFVQKTEDKKDLRVCYVGLTAAGKVRIERALDAAVDSDKRLGLARLHLVK
jgi:hypothetical protein